MEEERLLASPSVHGGNGRVNDVFKELRIVGRIVVPGVIFRITLFACVIVAQMFLGHENSVVLAAFAIVQTVIFRFVNGIMIGMSSATETLCGQAFGAGQYHMLGVYLQRSWIVNVATVTFCLPLFLFTKQIMLGIGQNKQVAEAAGALALWFIPLSYSYVFNFSSQMYLQAQMKNAFLCWISVPSLVLQLLLSFLLVQYFNFGYSGAMLSMDLANWMIIIAEFVYIFGGWCTETWKGFSKAAIADLLPVVRLSVSSGVMVCLELWYYSLIVLLAGYLENADIQISAFSICLNMNTWQFNLCLGFLTAASVRVSNELGRGNAEAAKFSIKVIICTSGVIGMVCFFVSLIFQRQIARVFTSNDEVVQEIATLALPLAFSMLINSFQSVLSGIAVGSGLQSTVAVVNLGSFYGVGLPLGACLLFLTEMKIIGLWIGMLSGSLLQVVVVGFLLWRSDWDQQVKNASNRLNRWFLESAESNGHP